VDIIQEFEIKISQKKRTAQPVPTNPLFPMAVYDVQPKAECKAA